jgi:hypothetical protein
MIEWIFVTFGGDGGIMIIVSVMMVGVDEQLRNCDRDGYDQGLFPLE